MKLQINTQKNLWKKFPLIFIKKISLLERDVRIQHGIDPNLNRVSEDYLATYGSSIIDALNAKYEELNSNKKDYTCPKDTSNNINDSKAGSLGKEIKKKHKILQQKSKVEANDPNAGANSLYIDEKKLIELEKIATENIHNLSSTIIESGPVNERRCPKGIINQGQPSIYWVFKFFLIIKSKLYYLW